MRKTIKNRIQEIINKTSDHKSIHVRLDYKTFMTLDRMSSLKVWLKRYPEAKVLTT